MTTLQVVGKFPHRCLVIDGKECKPETDYFLSPLASGTANFSVFDTQKMSITIRSSKFYNQVSAVSLSQWIENFSSVIVTHTNREIGGNDIGIELGRNGQETSLGVVLRFDFYQWKNPWSQAEYSNELCLVTQNRSLVGVSAKAGVVLAADLDRWPLGVTIYFTEMSLASTLEELLPSVLSTTESLHEEAVTNLSLKTYKHIVTAQFQFPDEVAVPCEQYLECVRHFGAVWQP